MIERPLPNGQALRLVRLARGLSRHQLAQRARIGKARLQLIERGADRPTVAEVARLLGALATDPDGAVADPEPAA